jgi:opacity protein-like surface antigen
MKKTLILALLALAALPAVASAAAKPGSYAGTSSSSVNVYGGGTKVDKGKVTFTVKNNKVSAFKLKGQEMQCNAGAAEFPLKVPTIKLNSKGKGSVTYNDPMVGSMKVTITVTSKGTATGTLKNPSMSTGMCQPDHPVKFTAKTR